MVGITRNAVTGPAAVSSRSQCQIVSNTGYTLNAQGIALSPLFLRGSLHRTVERDDAIFRCHGDARVLCISNLPRARPAPSGRSENPSRAECSCCFGPRRSTHQPARRSGSRSSPIPSCVACSLLHSPSLGPLDIPKFPPGTVCNDLRNRSFSGSLDLHPQSWMWRQKWLLPRVFRPRWHLPFSSYFSQVVQRPRTVR